MMITDADLLIHIATGMMDPTSQRICVSTLFPRHNLQSLSKPSHSEKEATEKGKGNTHFVTFENLLKYAYSLLRSEFLQL